MDKKKWQIILKVLISAVLFGVIFSRIDFADVLSNFKLVDIRYLPLPILFIILNWLIGAFRWKSLLIHKSSEKVTVKYLTHLYFVGAFFNNFMPTSVGGDVYKVLALGKKIGSKTDAFAATFMERFTGVMALVLISYFGLARTLDFWIEQLPEIISDNSLYLTFFKFLVFFGFWIGVAVAFLLLKILSKKIGILGKIYNSLLVYKDRRGVLLSAFLTSFVIQLLSIFTQYFVFVSMGITFPITYSLFVFPVIALATFFIPSLNGLGVQDALFIQFFSSSGVPVELALSASIIYHLLRLFVSLFGGILYVFNKEN
ncbi:hypothetical protein A2886_00985 [candidate division WWE3 bacterium RIFCSPHIGHO2_01_FULL_42_13]|uniref:Flippase-like domain-containing protein n=1 Tax=candidate division WWE3 bacterium RIFCSPHIGHO2_01_FULL_42_13 TaxID=1802617 RepID=A0A1F4UQH3_UNCKA|nr:MAG: hypothetical protein A2886_00985 [candidate division WWE3 bacterium RIFCSPHIGHO2_01_FULL_42_13]